jgi:protein phosphatase 1 regulatory subunit 7
MNAEDRKRIFLEVLPEEEFIDRRIDNSEMIEPESDSENDNIKFVDEYDTSGSKVNVRNKVS